jgi:anti-sigma factor RsiW
MNCEDIRPHLHDFVMRRLDPVLRGDVIAHLENCAACASAQRSEQSFDELLQQRLPRFVAPPPLKRRLGLLMGRPELARTEPRRWTRILAPAMAAALALVVSGVALKVVSSRSSEPADLASELVNDHLRVLASQHPVDVESGGSHQVKPWFEGKLDFAPVVPAPEGGELKLRGGALGYVFDRKAAVLVYGLRLHVVTLLVFRADGLDWPEAGRQLGPVRGSERSARGFNVMLWQHGGLAYALVSDVNPAELSEVAAQFAAATAQPHGP